MVDYQSGSFGKLLLREGVDKTQVQNSFVLVSGFSKDDLNYLYSVINLMSVAYFGNINLYTLSVIVNQLPGNNDIIRLFDIEDLTEKGFEDFGKLAGNALSIYSKDEAKTIIELKKFLSNYFEEVKLMKTKKEKKTQSSLSLSEFSRALKNGKRKPMTLNSLDYEGFADLSLPAETSDKKKKKLDFDL